MTEIVHFKVYSHRASVAAAAAAANTKSTGAINPSVKRHLWSLPLAARCALALRFADFFFICLIRLVLVFIWQYIALRIK